MSNHCYTTTNFRETHQEASTLAIAIGDYIFDDALLVAAPEAQTAAQSSGKSTEQWSRGVLAPERSGEGSFKVLDVAHDGGDWIAWDEV